ncbi:MAG: tetratricopeptide repeat protein [Myxococcota bacterium]
MFEAGRAAFDGGRFEEALEHFERAYALSGRSALLFNIGHTAERLRRDERAIEAFTEFLEANPESPQRAAVSARLALLQEHRDAAPEPSPPVAPPEPDGPPALAYVLLTTGAVSLAGAALSAGLAVSSANAVNDAQPGTPWSSVRGDERAAQRRRRAAGISAALGVAAVVGAVVWIASANQADVAVGPGSVQLRGRF